MDIFKIKVNWPTTAAYMNIISEMENQLDVVLILKKITFLENAIINIVKSENFKQLGLNGKSSIENEPLKRRKYFVF